MERISVRVDERLKKELEAEAREKGVRPSDIVREAMEKHVRRRAPRESHSSQLGAGPGIGPTGGTGLARSARWMATRQ